jgi:predicted regulator of Ras-like GTPase activity (Roadblock/LC7/MglB family)
VLEKRKPAIGRAAAFSAGVLTRLFHKPGLRSVQPATLPEEYSESRRLSHVDAHAEPRGKGASVEGRMSTAPTQLRRTDQIQDILRGLRTSSSEVIGAAIVSAEGFIAASLLPSEVDEEVVAGMGAALLGVAERIAKELMHADMVQTYVRSANGYIILNQVGDDAVLVVLTTEHAKLGLVFLDIKRRIPDLLRLL